ncbi:hypothetical protein ORQ95_02770 [Leptospira kirschneri]|uniref:hypothetical protein n=1 Tax=Leptospira kirschneri TaxID=29507 RepID=UPI00226098C7|nr:hypothetical protein [Leptospira kirschneri]UZW36625.1 hypothetical protein ORQ95_02770 [Leptospira kirschneri]WHP00324.1 hypothetical protein QMK36_02775 [Leptospira kirschneri]
MKKLVLMISLLLQCQCSGAWIDEVEMNHETGLCKWESILFLANCSPRVDGTSDSITILSCLSLYDTYTKDCKDKNHK